MKTEHKWKDALWIWHDEVPPAGEYRRGWFRYGFHIGKVHSAWLYVSANGGFALHINGRTVSREQPSANYRYDITPFLVDGANVIALDAECEPDVPFGLFAYGCVMGDDGTELIVHTDEAWRMSRQEPDADWAQPGFDDGDWSCAASIETHLLNVDWVDGKTPLIDPNDVQSPRQVNRAGREDFAALMAGFAPTQFHAAIDKHCPGQRSIPADRIPIVTDGGLFPVLCRLDCGEIVAVVRSGGSHVGMKGRLDCVRSEDEGKTWSAPVTLADSENDERAPALGQAADGTVVMAWRTAVYYCDGPKIVETTVHSHLNVIRSSDGGRTWSEPMRVDVSPFAGGTPYRKMIALEDGTVLLPFYGQHEGRTCSCALWSRDNGRTWSRPKILIEGPGETAFVQLPGGELLSLARDSGWMHLRRSGDLGRTWSESELFSHEGKSIHPGDLTMLSDARVLATYGYRIFPFGTRARISDDDGHTWSKEFVLIDDSLNWDCGYPSSVQLSDGRILSAQYATASRTRPELGVHCMGIIWDPDATHTLAGATNHDRPHCL